MNSNEMTMVSLTIPLLFTVLILSIEIEKVASTENPCEVSAPQKCSSQNQDLLTAVQSNDANTICQTYHGYRDCLYQQSTACSDTDFIGHLLNRSCQDRCFGCGGAGVISGSLSTVIILGTLVTVYFTSVF